MGINEKRELGRRLSIWIPKECQWIFDALRERVKVLENRGIRSGMGEQAKKILYDALKNDLIKEATDETKEGTDNL
jgi:hypothetical protein